MQKLLVQTKIYVVWWQTFIHAACNHSRGILQGKNHREKKYQRILSSILIYYRNTARQKKKKKERTEIILLFEVTSHAVNGKFQLTHFWHSMFKLLTITQAIAVTRLAAKVLNLFALKSKIV